MHPRARSRGFTRWRQSLASLCIAYWKQALRTHQEECPTVDKVAETLLEDADWWAVYVERLSNEGFARPTSSPRELQIVGEAFGAARVFFCSDQVETSGLRILWALLLTQWAGPEYPTQNAEPLAVLCNVQMPLIGIYN